MLGASNMLWHVMPARICADMSDTAARAHRQFLTVAGFRTEQYSHKNDKKQDGSLSSVHHGLKNSRRKVSKAAGAVLSTRNIAKHGIVATTECLASKMRGRLHSTPNRSW